MKYVSTAIAAAVLSAAAMPAEAGSRLFFGFRPYQPGYYNYYPGPLYIPAPRYSYYYEPPYAYDYEPDYYEPEYQPRIYKPKPKAKAQKAPPPKAKPKPALISCGKASKIVAGYGFSEVKSTDCKGDVYAFKATRDGKSFTIKLSSKNGELTEVKKL